MIEKKLLNSSFYSKIKNTYEVSIFTEREFNANPQVSCMCFFTSRLKTKFSNKRWSEYVIIPSFSNPRWVIKNSRRTISDHGLLVKPTSLLSKLIWQVALFLNFFNLFNFIFPDRFISSRGLFEENVLNQSVDDFEVEIIYTGSPGLYQKFTFKIYSKKEKSKYFLKLGTTEKSVERIQNEARVLSLLDKYRFLYVVIPSVVGDLKSNKFHGIMLKNILHTNDLQINNIKISDMMVMVELYKKMGVKEVMFEEYINQNSFYEDCPCTLPVEFYNNSIYLGFSHGDYIPWNRFIGEENTTKVIDWEVAKYRPLFYDLFTFIIITGILIEKQTIEKIFNSCVRTGLNFLSLLNAQILVVNQSRKNILMYLFLDSLEMFYFYKSHDSNVLSNKITQDLSGIIKLSREAMIKTNIT